MKHKLKMITGLALLIAGTIGVFQNVKNLNQHNEKLQKPEIKKSYIEYKKRNNKVYMGLSSGVAGLGLCLFGTGYLKRNEIIPAPWIDNYRFAI